MSNDPAIPILTIRGESVILDTDLAALYGVPTFRFNEAIKRNRHRFPADFMFQLTRKEFDSLRSQFVSKPAAALTSQFAMSKPGRGGRRTLPYAFTEHGALQAANVLKSEAAAGMSIYVIRAFVQMRRELAVNAAVLKRLAEIDRTLLQHDSALRDLYQKLLPLLSPPPDPPKRRIGFQD